jgi:hypothetical protein
MGMIIHSPRRKLMPVVPEFAVFAMPGWGAVIHMPFQFRPERQQQQRSFAHHRKEYR